VLVAEAALGKFLPDGAEVHHVDGVKGRNVGGNLVVCQDRGYHMLLEQRTRALIACGDANAKRCCICHGYENQADIVVVNTKSGRFRAHHRACQTLKREETKRARVIKYATLPLKADEWTSDRVPPKASDVVSIAGRAD